MREIMLAAHFIGLVMGLGTSFAHLFLSMVVPKMDPNEAIKFRLHTLVLSRMGHIGISLLIISGFYLITPYWNSLSSSPLLIAKLVLVSLLVILIILIELSAKKAKQGNAAVALEKMAPLGKATLVIGVAIVLLAVYIFH